MSFADALRAAGLRPREVVADGRIRRCTTESKPGKRNGWYVLHPDGRGSWGDWTSGSGEALGHWKDQHATVQQVSPQAAERMRQQREQELLYRVQAMRSARAFWQRCSPLNRLHPYLERKGLSPMGCAGLRQHDGNLVIPVMNGDWLVSVQQIDPAGVKRFWPGAPVKAGCFVLKRERAAVTCIAEGLATGLAVFQAVRHASVVVAFDAGNLLPVIDRMRPAGSVVICADNDAGTQARRGFNPGLDKARNAAELIGCGVAYPTDLEGSDWSDYMLEHGPQAARRIERLILAGARYVSGATT